MNKKSKNTLLLIVLLAILGISIGYAALSQNLTINGTSKIVSDWAIEITNIESKFTSGETGAVDNSAPTVGDDKVSATFDVTLYYPGAVATYDVTVENKGSINAKLDSISGIDTANSTTPTDVKYSITPTTNTLAAGDTTTYTVTVEWEKGDTNTVPETNGTTKTATITLNYVQETN